ncbi:MAG: VWFA-related Acidobacterial domain protein [Acidobacteria bacterium]|nr:VWFA-related Acidobacterial domain protein [Acidobacteriota bacterium]
MIRALAFTLSTLFALAANGEVWSGDLDAALVRAEGEQKLVLLHLRGGCGRRCNEPLDKLLAEAGRYAPIATAYQHFILVRSDELSRSAAMKKVLAQKPRRPSLLLVDPEGQMLQPRRPFQSANELIDFLSLVRDQAPQIVRAAELRKAGRRGEADLALGDAFLHLESVEKARDLFRSAASEFRKANDRKDEEFARTYASFAEYFYYSWGGNAAKAQMAVIDLLRVAEFPGTPSNAAEAWMAIGGIRKSERDPAGAIRAYRRAYELAAAGSITRDGARQELEHLGDTWAAAQHDAAAAQATIRVIAPPRSTISGRAEFIANTTVVVARVAFLLDGDQVATVDQPPFRVRIDVGALPRLSIVKAVAFDRTGKPIGEATATINDRVDAFRVAILSPVAERIDGNVVVEADARVPEGRRVTNVELYWNEAKLRRFDGAPYRLEFVAPKAFGYLRAVATLDDGRTAEDTRVYNAGTVSETFEVHAVGFSATVVDGSGKRIEGLSGKDFAARDEGLPVTVTDRAFSDEPATIGIAIDASRSMRTSLLDLFEAATQLVDITASPKSRVFLVAFDTTPRLIHPPSSDAASLRASILALNPTGATAAVDAITFALQQFRGVGGRRALIVITDGRDGPNSQSTTACTRMAMETGVPIYVVIPKVYRSSPFGNGLLGISEATGGLLYQAAEKQEMPSIFTRIRDEVMGQYLLSITGSRQEGGEWRRLSVEVPGRGARVRTIRGYYAR